MKTSPALPSLLHRLFRGLLPALPFLTLLPTLPAQDQAPAPKPQPPVYSFLWKVEKEGLATSYLFGTMHTPDPRVNSLHPKVKEVLSAADAFYAELAMDDMGELEAGVTEVGILPAGETLEDLIGFEAYEDLGKVLERYSLPPGMLQRLRPFMAEATLGQLELMQEMRAGKKALDERLYLVSKGKGKEVGGVETIAEQINMLAYSRTEEEQIDGLQRALKKELARKEGEPSGLSKLTAAYLTGSEARIWATVSEDFDTSNEGDLKFYRALIPDRNKVMATRSGKLMLEHPQKSYVFAFGTLHFLNDVGVPALLREQGFSVTRLLAPADNLELPEEEIEEATDEAVGALEGQLQGLGGGR